MPRQEFTKATKLAAFNRCGGHCQTCGQKILGTPEYHHLVPAALDGSNDIDNCAVLCRKCHGTETATVTVPTVAKAKRVLEKRAGLRKSSRGFRKAPANWDSFNRRWRDEG